MIFQRFWSAKNKCNSRTEQTLPDDAVMAGRVVAGVVLLLAVAIGLWYEGHSIWAAAVSLLFQLIDVHEAAPGFWMYGPQLRKVQQWQPVESDVLAVAYPRSGTHLAMNLITQLIATQNATSNQSTIQEDFKSIHHVPPSRALLCGWLLCGWHLIGVFRCAPSPTCRG